ncbi:MAG: OmpH family outer membrane protein [Desulfovibrionaceae bacterium]|nr:OmpH family outer membrane protein [Desulfovibrionaceae bacterium]
MRTSLVAALILALGLLTAGQVQAEDNKTSRAAGLRIGIVDVQTVVMESDMAKAIKNHMQSKYGDERKKLEQQGESLKKRAEELKNPKTSDKKRAAFIRERQSLDQKFRTLMQKAEQEQMQYNQKMVSQIFASSKKVAESLGYNLILDVGQGGVLYADPDMNLTDAVLKEINAFYKENKIDLKK